MYASIPFKYSTNTAKCFLHRCLFTFRVFSDYVERMENMQNEIFYFPTMPDEVKGTLFQENQIGDHKLPYDEQYKF